MRRFFAFGLLLFLVLPVSSLAQQGTAELRCRLVDPQGAVLPGVAVVVRNQDTGMYREGVTDAAGTFFVTGLVPGRYEVVAELEGFRRTTLKDVVLEVGRTTSVDVKLDVGGLQEAVTVTAETPLVDVSSKEIGGNIRTKELAELPTITRNYIGFVGLLPGIVPNISTESFGSDSINVNGQDARNNNYMLDGANNNDDVIGQRAGTQARTPLESVQEFQVLTNQFDAEFGRTQGAVINAVTKQGTNQFRGSTFGYFQDAGLTKKDYFVANNPALQKPDTKQQQFGGTLGGPIVRDKAHFFLSLERVIIDQGITSNIPARPELTWSGTQKTRVWNTLVRFDNQLSAGQTWGVRWLREYSPQFDQIIIPPAITQAATREEDDLDQTLVGTLSSVLGGNRLNTLRVSWTQEDVKFANSGYNSNGQRQDQLPPTLAYLTFTDQQSATAQARINNAYAIDDTFSWYVPGWKGDHDFKVGLQYQYSSNDFRDDGNLNGTFTFPTNGPFDAANPRTYPDRFSIRVPSSLTYYMKAHYFSAFFQDKWKVNNRLTLSAGARYDLEVIPLKELDNPEFSDANDYPVDANNVAPRLGFSYDWAGDGRMVVRGGYGLFYDKTHFELITAIITSGVFSNSFTANFPADRADPGPSNGQFPTNPFLVGGPTVNRALVEQLFPAGSRLRNTGNVFFDSTDRHIPYSQQLSIGVERRFGANASVSADFVHSWARDQFMTRDLNPGVRANTSRTGPITRVDPAFSASVFQRINVGRTDYDALMLQLDKRFSRSFSARVSYTLSKSRGNTSGDGTPQANLQFLDDLNLDDYEGPTNFDRRHNLVVSGTSLIPKTGGLTVAWIARYLSGLPFTLQDTNTDADRNGVLFDPLPSGSYSGTGTNSYEVENDGGRNGARGPDFFELDLRLGYRVKVGRERTLDVFGEVFNVTNRANFDSPSGDRRSSNFLVLTALRPGGIPMTGQLGVRLAF